MPLEIELHLKDWNEIYNSDFTANKYEEIKYVDILKKMDNIDTITQTERNHFHGLFGVRFILPINDKLRIVSKFTIR